MKSEQKVIAVPYFLVSLERKRAYLIDIALFLGPRTNHIFQIANGFHDGALLILVIRYWKPAGVLVGLINLKMPFFVRSLKSSNVELS